MQYFFGSNSYNDAPNSLSIKILNIPAVAFLIAQHYWDVSWMEIILLQTSEHWVAGTWKDSLMICLLQTGVSQKPLGVFYEKMCS